MTHTREGQISRRRVVQGAVWAAPAILIATAAPALAASLPPASLTLASRTVGFKEISYTFSIDAEMALEGGFTVVASTTHDITGATAGSGWTASPAGTLFTHAAPHAGGALTFAATLRFISNDTGHILTTFTLFDRDGRQLAVAGPV